VQSSKNEGIEVWPVLDLHLSLVLDGMQGTIDPLVEECSRSNPEHCGSEDAGGPGTLQVHGQIWPSTGAREDVLHLLCSDMIHPGSNAFINCKFACSWSRMCTRLVFLLLVYLSCYTDFSFYTPWLSKGWDRYLLFCKPFLHLIFRVTDVMSMQLPLLIPTTTHLTLQGLEYS
jgi:hypothetical protein